MTEIVKFSDLNISLDLHCPKGQPPHQDFFLGPIQLLSLCPSTSPLLLHASLYKTASTLTASSYSC